jgi:hypothetical protein
MKELGIHVPSYIGTHAWVTHQTKTLGCVWVVQPDIHANGTQFASIVHLDAIFHAAHLLPIYRNVFVPSYLDFSQSLDAFHSYYVNKYVDHHAFEIVF